MKDRVPLYPGRVKLEPVAGQANTYDMTRADQPQQAGTKLNKASLLTDETVAKIWANESERPADPTPNDALAALVRPEKTAVGSYVGTGDLSGKLGSFASTGTFSYSDQRCIIQVGDKIIKLSAAGHIGVSTDGGETYSEVAELSQQDNQTWFSMCYGNGVYVAVSTNYYAWSENLTTWTVAALSQAGGSRAYVAFGDGTFVISTQGGIYFYSDDGKTFTRTLSVVDGVGGKVIYADGKFVCAGSLYTNYTKNCAYSVDKGRTWQVAPILGLSNVADGVRLSGALTYAREKFFAFGYDSFSQHSYMLLSSETGESWSVECIPFSVSNQFDWTCLHYQEDIDTLYLFGSGIPYYYVSPVYSDIWISKSVGTGAAFFDALSYNGKILLAGYWSDSAIYNVYVTPLTPLYFPTDFKPKFVLVYRQDAQPTYENYGKTVWQHLFVTSEQTTFKTNADDVGNASTTSITAVAFKDDGVYIYNFYSINVINAPYTWFAVG